MSRAHIRYTARYKSNINDTRPQFKSDLAERLYRQTIERTEYINAPHVSSISKTNPWASDNILTRESYQPGRTMYSFNASPYAFYSSIYTPVEATNGIHSTTIDALNPTVVTRSKEDVDQFAANKTVLAQCDPIVYDAIHIAFTPELRQQEKLRRAQAAMSTALQQNTKVLNILELEDNDDEQTNVSMYDELPDVSSSLQPHQPSLGLPNTSLDHHNTTMSSYDLFSMMMNADNTHNNNNLDTTLLHDTDSLLSSLLSNDNDTFGYNNNKNDNNTLDSMISSSLQTTWGQKIHNDHHHTTTAYESNLLQSENKLHQSKDGSVLRDVSDDDIDPTSIIDVGNKEYDPQTGQLVSRTKKRGRNAQNGPVYEVFDGIEDNTEISIKDILKNATFITTPPVRSSSDKTKKDAKLEKELAMISKELNIMTEEEERVYKRQKVLGLAPPPQAPNK